MSLIRPTGGSRTEREEPTEYYVLGGDSIGEAIVDRLRADDHSVRLLDVEQADGTPASGPDLLERTGLDGASTVVVATESDGRNLLVAQQVSTRFDVDRVLVLVHDPPRLESFLAAGHEPICATTALTDAVVEEL